MQEMAIAVAALMLTFVGVMAQDTGSKAPDRKTEAEPAGEAKAEAGEEKEAGIQFLHDLAEAKKQAEEGNKKLFVVFGTTWCGPCKMLKAKVWSKDAIAERVAKDFVPVYVDGDEDRAAVKEFEVKAYPTIILAEADGKLIAKESGSGGKLTPEAWSMWIDQQLGATGKLDALIAAVEKNPQDAASLRSLADAYYELGRKDEAVQYYSKAEAIVEEELIQIKLRKCELLMAGMKDDPTVREVLDELIPKLLKKKDERVIEISLSFANIVARMADEKDPARGRQMMLDLKEAFPEHKGVIEFRCRAGMFAHMDGDNDTALTEMRAIAEEYKDSEDEAEKIWVDRCHRFIKKIEDGGRYR